MMSKVFKNQHCSDTMLGVYIGHHFTHKPLHNLFFSFPTIPRNTSIPTCKKQIYFSPKNTTCVSISVYQGEHSKVKDNILLGRFDLRSLTPGVNGESQLEVCFKIDANGILRVSAQEISTGQNKINYNY
ncbi:putative Heat shock protein 70 family [Helianthus anomalus]